MFNISYNIAYKILFTIQMFKVDISYSGGFTDVGIPYTQTEMFTIQIDISYNIAYLCRNSLHTDARCQTPDDSLIISAFDCVD
jgi:hypothetical protein